MDYTQGTERFKRERSKKQMLWFGIISLCMSFAGLTSAYIVSMERRDWNSTYDFPQALVWSTVIIIISSLTIHLAKKAILSGRKSQGTLFILITLGLGIAFVISQIQGYGQLTAQGLYFTGPVSNITGTFITLIGVVHAAHVFAGFIALVVMVIKQFQGKYTKERHLGLSLGVTFWHFLDILWVFLFLLLYCTRHWCEWTTCV